MCEKNWGQIPKTHSEEHLLLFLKQFSIKNGTKFDRKLTWLVELIIC